jgi:hypothetical protein
MLMTLGAGGMLAAPIQMQITPPGGGGVAARQLIPHPLQFTGAGPGGTAGEGKGPATAQTQTQTQ